MSEPVADTLVFDQPEDFVPCNCWGDETYSVEVAPETDIFGLPFNRDLPVVIAGTRIESLPPELRE